MENSQGSVNLKNGRMQAPAAATTPRRRIAVELGRGLDVGTANLVAAVQDKQGEAIIRSFRNAFIDVPIDAFTKKMLNQLGVNYAVQDGKAYVLASAAFELANIFNRETRRPMRSGFISPKDADALPMIRLLTQKLMGQAAAPNELCYISFPAEPIDANLNMVYHRDIFLGLLRRVGYEPKPMQEGHALAIAELGNDDFTGMALSWGAGMCNICISYKAVPALCFSIARGGDWIDENAAAATGTRASKIAALKERGLNLLKPEGKEQEAVAIYYRNLIQYVLKCTREQFEHSASMPSFPDPIPVVCSGGTSLSEGFVEVFKQEYKKTGLPIEVKEVRRAIDPLNSVARGCLIAARSES